MIENVMLVLIIATGIAMVGWMLESEYGHLLTSARRRAFRAEIRRRRISAMEHDLGMTPCSLDECYCNRPFRLLRPEAALEMLKI